MKTQELNKLQQSTGEYTMYIQFTCIPVRLGTSTMHLYLSTSTSAHRTVKDKYMFSKLCLSTMFFLYHSSTVSSTNTTKAVRY